MKDIDTDTAGPGGRDAGRARPGAWWRLRRAWVVALWATAPGLAGASGFSVAPVRLFFGEKDRAVAVRLSNEGSTERVLHADVQAWSQDGQGRDRLEPSDDLVVSPTVLRIRPHAEQVVRLILVTPRDSARQMSYRLFLREQPPATALQGTEGARLLITLTLSLPVFITPARTRSAGWPPPRSCRPWRCARTGGARMRAWAGSTCAMAMRSSRGTRAACTCCPAHACPSRWPRIRVCRARAEGR